MNAFNVGVDLRPGGVEVDRLWQRFDKGALVDVVPQAAHSVDDHSAPGKKNPPERVKEGGAGNLL